MKGLMQKLVAVCALFAISALAHATDVRLDGSGSYTVDPASGSVSIDFSRVTNYSSNTTSGTLYLQLWASPDSDPVGSGYALTDNLNVSTFTGGGDGTLEPGASFVDIEINTAYNPPPEGDYYVFFILAEDPNTDTILDDSPGVGNPVSLGGSSGGGGTDGGGTDGGGTDGGGGTDDGGGSSGGSSGLELVCNPCGYETDQDFVTLEASSVENNRSGGYSGTLKLKLWATDYRYTGGTITGHIMATARLGELDGGYAFNNLSEEVAFIEPPDGTYNVTMTLTEYDGEDKVVDYITFDDTVTFDSGGSSGGTGDGGGTDGGGTDGGGTAGGGTDGGDDGGSDGGGGGGGGLIDPFFVLLLAIATGLPAIRRAIR